MEEYENYTDEELIVQLHNGNQNIEEYLINKYKSLVRKKAHAMYLMGGETDDLIQEGMIGLFKAVRDYRPDKNASFVTFAVLCIERQIYNAIQISTRQKHKPLNSYVSLSDQEEAPVFENTSLWQQNPETIVIDQENALGMEKHIKQVLSSFENQVLELYLKGDGYLKIAETLNKPQKSIDNALQRIRGKVKEYLETIT